MQRTGLVAYGAAIALAVLSMSRGAGTASRSGDNLPTVAPENQDVTSAKFPKPMDLPVQAALPDPLVMLDGRKVASLEMWRKERRPELIGLFQHYMYGQLPPKPALVTGKVERVDEAAFGGKATLSEVTLAVGPPEVPAIHLMLVVPNKRSRPAPVVLAINYFGNHTAGARQERPAGGQLDAGTWPGSGDESRDRGQPRHVGGDLADRGRH